MPLWNGTPEWAYSLFLGRDRGLRVPLPPSQYEFDGFPVSVSSVCTRVLAGLSVLPFHGRLTLSMRPFTLQGGRGEMAMVAPCCHPFHGTACAVGLI